MERKNDLHTKRDFRYSIRGYSQYAYLIAKSRWASWMERKTAKLSSFKLYLLLGTFLCGSGTYCVFLILQGLSGNNGIPAKQEPIHHVETTSMIAVPAPAANSANEYNEMIHFGSRMDSLLGSNPQLRDSVLNARPGLRDTILLLKNYYESNFKKEKYGK